MSRNKTLAKGIMIIGLAVLGLLFSQCVLAGEWKNVTGDFTLTTDTTVTGDKWIRAGNLTIQTGVTLTINDNSSLTFEPGYHITIQDGAYILVSASNAKIVKQEIRWSCGENVTFTYKGHEVTYGTVEYLGRCWLDRNLGASRVATSSNDSAAFGDYFQWGRLDDGHQNRNSSTTSVLSSSDNPGHNKFITVGGYPNDWRSPQNDNLWKGVNGINNPCPPGWRIPTSGEWVDVKLSLSPPNRDGAFNTPLKLPAAGYRKSWDGKLKGCGKGAFYWSSTTLGKYDYRSWCIVCSGECFGYWMFRADGLPVRCIRDE